MGLEECVLICMVLLVYEIMIGKILINRGYGMALCIMLACLDVGYFYCNLTVSCDCQEVASGKN